MENNQDISDKDINTANILSPDIRELVIQTVKKEDMLNGVMKNMVNAKSEFQCCIDKRNENEANISRNCVNNTW